VLLRAFVRCASQTSPCLLLFKSAWSLFILKGQLSRLHIPICFLSMSWLIFSLS
jgi:hypothetical protein